MFKKFWWFLSLILYLFFLLFISYFLFNLINLIFDLISCRFPPWFPRGREVSTNYDYLRDLYYFLGFLDYAAISLPEIISVDWKTSDPLLFKTICHMAWIYSGLVNNFNDFIYTLIYGNTEYFDINFVLKDLALNENYELNSLCANNMHIILMDPENSLDKYLFNFDIKEGSYQDIWEMNNIQVEYLKNLTRNSYVYSEYLYTKNSDELWNYKNIAISVEEETLLMNAYANFEETYGGIIDYPSKLSKTFAQYLKNPIDKEKHFALHEQLENITNISISIYLDFFFDKLIYGVNLADFSKYLIGENRALSYEYNHFMDNDLFKYIYKSSFIRHNDSFSLFYKLVMHTNRFFFDNLYIYFYIEKYNILIRINRFVLLDIFHKNIILGLSDFYKYPYSILWDYNYYELFNVLFGTPYKSDLGLIFELKKPINHIKIMNITNPFDFVFPEEDDFFLYGDFWNFLTNKDPMNKVINSNSFEWFVNFIEYRDETLIYNEEFYKTHKTIFGSSCTPELTSDAYSFDETLKERDRRWRKKELKKLLIELKKHAKRRRPKPFFLFRKGKPEFKFEEDEDEDDIVII